MTTIEDIISKFEDTCNKRDVPYNPMIEVVLNVERDENILAPKSCAELYLAGNNPLLNVPRLNDLDAALIFDWLETDEFVTALDLRYNMFSDDGVEYIARLIRTNKSIHRINLMCNDFSDEGAKHLAEALHTNTTLKCLRINGNKIGNQGGLYFAQALQINTTLEILDLADADLRSECLVALATVLNHNTSLKAINVSRPLLTSVQDDTIDHFARMLKVNSSLEELHLMKFGMMDFGAIRLAEDLRNNSSLVYLNLGCNKISSDGILELSDLLKTNRTLKVLDLSLNRIGDKGAEYLAEALATKNSTLVSLDVRQNAISGAGLSALADSMRINTSLAQIFVWGNKVEDDSGCEAFKNLYDTGRLTSADTDVEPYLVDGKARLSQLSNGLRCWYYWGPWYGQNALPDLTKFLKVADPSRRP